MEKDYDSETELTEEMKKVELNWWTQNVHLKEDHCYKIHLSY